MNTDPEVNGDQESKEGMNGLSMEQLMENSLQSLKEGEVVHGTVVAVTSEEVLVDIGYKCEGSVAVAEFTDPDTNEVQVQVNDEVEVFVERLDEAEGRVRLSRSSNAAEKSAWSKEKPAKMTMAPRANITNIKGMSVRS